MIFAKRNLGGCHSFLKGTIYIQQNSLFVVYSPLISIYCLLAPIASIGKSSICNS